MKILKKNIYRIYYKMEVQGVNVQKIVEANDPIIVGIHKNRRVFLKNGKFGWYLSYDSKNFSIPSWVHDPEAIDLYQAVKIIDYKLSNKQQLEVKIPESHSLGERQRKPADAGASSDAFVKPKKSPFQDD